MKYVVDIQALLLQARLGEVCHFERDCENMG